MSQLSLERITYVLVGLLLPLQVIRGQGYGEQGLGGGSSVVLLPTTATIPTADFRIQIARQQYLTSSSPAFQALELTGGLSTHAELHLRVALERTASRSDNPIFGVGGKLRLPLPLAIIEEASVWLESVQAGSYDQTSLIQETLMRMGVAAGLFMEQELTSIVVAAVTRGSRTIYGTIGLGASVTVSPIAKINGEITRGYHRASDTHFLMSGILKILPHASVQLSPGYYMASGRSGWMVSLGISCSTAEISFLPQVTTKEEFLIPSLEEIGEMLK